MALIHHLYCRVSESQIATFAQRARAEGLNVEEALVALVEFYNHGGTLRQEARKAHAKPTGVDYAAEAEAASAKAAP